MGVMSRTKKGGLEDLLASDSEGLDFVNFILKNPGASWCGYQPTEEDSSRLFRHSHLLRTVAKVPLKVTEPRLVALRTSNRARASGRMGASSSCYTS